MTATDWWTDLYAPAHSDTLSGTVRPVAGGGRLPPPGQTVDLAKPTTATTDEPAEDKMPPRRPRRTGHGRPDYDRIAELEREIYGAPIDDPVEDDADDWAEIPDETTQTPDERAAIAGTARIQQAYRAFPGRARWLVYNGGAAGAGWELRLVQPVHGFLVGCGQQTGDQVAAVILGAGICGLIAWRWDTRTRHWWGPLPWLCRIPLASAVLALGLYAPGH